MYYYNKEETVKVERVGEGQYKYHHRPTKIVCLSSISAIPTDTYKTFIDDRIENPNKSIPEVVADEDIVKLGDLCKIDENSIFRLEKEITNEDLNIVILSIQGKNLDTEKSELKISDCDHLGIQYKKGLYSFQKSGIKLHKFDPLKKEWNPNDLSTYPLVGENTQIKYLLLQLGGFKSTGDNSVLITPKGSIIDLELFLVSLKVKLKQGIDSLSSSCSWEAGEEISWSVIYENFKGSERQNKEEDICDILGNIYIILKLSKNGKGISPFSIKDKSAEDLFEVSYDESYSIGNTEIETVQISDKIPRYDFNIFTKNRNFYWRTVDINKETKQIYVPLTQSR